MTDSELETTQQRAVGALLALVPRSWKRIFVHYEIQDLDDDTVCSEVSFAVVKRPFRAPERIEIVLGQQAMNFTKLLRDAGALAMKAEGTRCVSMDLIVRSDSDFDWFFDYSPPPLVTATLSGDLTAVYRNSELRKPYRKYADRDEWLAQIP